jgi:hypothetical protein
LEEEEESGGLSSVAFDLTLEREGGCMRRRLMDMDVWITQSCKADLSSSRPGSLTEGGAWRRDLEEEEEDT